MRFTPRDGQVPAAPRMPRKHNRPTACFWCGCTDQICYIDYDDPLYWYCESCKEGIEESMASQGSAPVRVEVEHALLLAAIHVNRQQFAGKHEQDRADAVEWLRQWSPLIDRVRRKAEKQRNDSAKEKE